MLLGLSEGSARQSTRSRRGSGRRIHSNGRSTRSRESRAHKGSRDGSSGRGGAHSASEREAAAPGVMSCSSNTANKPCAGEHS